MSGHASASILSRYFELEVIDGVRTTPARDDDRQFTRDEQRLRAWLAPRVGALSERIDALVAGGLALDSMIDLASGPPARARIAQAVADPEVDGGEVGLIVAPRGMRDGAASGRSAMPPGPDGYGAGLDADLERTLRDGLRAALATPRRAGASPQVVPVELEHLRAHDFHLSIRAQVSAVDARHAPAMAMVFAAAVAAIEAGLERGRGGAAALPLIANGPEVRSGIDDHYFIQLERGWLAILVIIRAADHRGARKAIAATIDAALADIGA